MGEFGHTSRQIDQLRSEIKRWTWAGRPTRKARRLYALQHNMRDLWPDFGRSYDSWTKWDIIVDRV